MKKSILFFLGLFFSVSALAQSGGDRITGKWEGEKAGTIIEIYKKSGKYEGRIAHIDEDQIASEQASRGGGDFDINKARELEGKVILTDLHYSSGKWKNGRMYIPHKGVSLGCNVKMRDKNTLELTLSKGFFSKKVIWKRVAG